MREGGLGGEQVRKLKELLTLFARYSAAHAPTQRAGLQTAEIAMKLHRGKALHEDEAEG